MRQLATEAVYGANIRSVPNPATLGEEYASPTTEDIAAGLHHVRAYQKKAGLKADCWPSETVLRSIAAAR